MRYLNWLLMLIGITFTQQSFAHARWALDGLVKPRTDSTGIKTGPCGAARTTNRVTDLIAGAKVQLKFESVIYHQGMFKIYFSAANDQNFVLLADNIKDYPNQQFQTYDLTLPDQACDKCTLQLIQTMPDAGNSLYYSCADIRLTKPQPADTSAPAAITNLILSENTQTIRLNWQNPPQDYAQTMIVQSLAPLTEHPQSGLEYKLDSTLGNGKVVMLGAQSEFQSVPLTSNTQYYFSVYALDSSRNYSPVAQVTGQLVAMNHTPEVKLLVEQSGQLQDKLSTGNGLVTVQAKITDADTNDRHLIDWAGTDARLVDTNITDRVFSFDPSKLKTGRYLVAVAVTDTGLPPMSNKGQIELQIEEKPQGLVTAGYLEGWEICCLMAFVLITARRQKLKL